MGTRVIKLDPGGENGAVVREAASCLAGGGLVVFPTETVYGLGANATDPQAVARLRKVKQRPADKPFTVHIGSRSTVDRFVPELRGVGRRLADKAWPGPLTLIFHVDDVQSAPVIRDGSAEHAAAMYHEGTIGIRCPDDRTAAGLLTEVGVPIVAASANPAGAAAPVQADEVIALLEGRADLVLDAGPTRYGRPSTIVHIDTTGYRLVREGVLDERTIHRLSSVNFLLVCSGNTCRSPMGAALLRRMLAERLGCDEGELPARGYNIESAGTAAVHGSAPSAAGIRALSARGIDISSHRSQPLALEQITRADYIFTMTADHVDAVAAISARARDRARRIDEDDITDPVGGNDEVYEQCARRIEKALKRRLEEIPL